MVQGNSNDSVVALMISPRSPYIISCSCSPGHHLAGALFPVYFHQVNTDPVLSGRILGATRNAHALIFTRLSVVARRSTAALGLTPCKWIVVEAIHGFISCRRCKMFKQSGYCETAPLIIRPRGLFRLKSACLYQGVPP